VARPSSNPNTAKKKKKQKKPEQKENVTDYQVAQKIAWGGGKTEI
jgi:hypothetical protein